MGRIKGWVSKKTIHPFCRNHSSMAYMEEIPMTAIRGEAVVSDRWKQVSDCEAGILVDLPGSLIGLKVNVIIIPEED